MSAEETAMPRTAQAFVEFAQVLRTNGFAIAPDQTISFIEAISLLGPQSLSDIYQAGIAMFAIPRERWGEYDALFRAFFLQQIASATTAAEREDTTEAYDVESGSREVDLDVGDEEAGQEASRMELLSHRQFRRREPADILRSLSRDLPRKLPRRRARRWQHARGGRRVDSTRQEWLFDSAE